MGSSSIETQSLECVECPLHVSALCLIANMYDFKSFPHSGTAYNCRYIWSCPYLIQYEKRLVKPTALIQYLFSKFITVVMTRCSEAIGYLRGRKYCQFSNGFF